MKIGRPDPAIAEKGDEPKTRPGPRNVETAAKRRALILSSASKVFLEQGFTDTNLDQVATECSVAKQTIYNYFETKEVLYLAAADFMMQEFAIQPSSDWSHLQLTDFLVRVAQFYLDVLQNRNLTNLLQLVVKDCRVFPNLEAMYTQAVIEPMLDVVIDHVKSLTSLSLPELRTIAWCFRNAINGYGTLVNLGAIVERALPDSNAFVEVTSRLTAEILTDKVVGAAETSKVKTHAAYNILSKRALLEINDFLLIELSEPHDAKQVSITAAAIAVFSAKGLANASMEEIAQRAGVSKQTVYSRFKSKALLYQCACGEAIRSLDKRSLLCLQEQQENRDPLESYCRILFAQTSRPWVGEFLKGVIGESRRPFPPEMVLPFIICTTSGKSTSTTILFQSA